MRTPLLSALFAAAFVASSAAAQTVDPRIQDVLSDVSAERLHEYLSTLTGFETRHSLSFSDRPDFGVLPARRAMRLDPVAALAGR